MGDLGPAYIELNFRPNVQLVSVVRRFVSDFYLRTLGDPDGSSRIALATHELLENAVKYSKDGASTISIESSGSAGARSVAQRRGESIDAGGPSTVTIRMRNRAEEQHVAAIREIVEGVAAATDAFAFYQKLLVAKAKWRDGSGLGLARICAEGEMQVSYRMLDEDTVEIQAVTQVRGAA